MECMELVKLKNIKAKICEPQAGSGAGPGLGDAERYMVEGHS